MSKSPSQSLSRTAALEAINTHLGRLAWLITRQLAQQLRDFELTLPQFVVLATLASQPQPCPMGQLAQLTRQTPATLTGIIDRLLKTGLVQRAGNSADRRAVLVAATPAGINQAQQIEHQLLQTISYNFAPLTDEALFTVEQLLLSVLDTCTQGAAPLPAVGGNSQNHRPIPWDTIQ